ncbi:flagellin [Geobacillus sp. 46C-IIa]|uniref:flagellin N-terminal helical domain-containing protein n=1 Tax=Geobacillus sp. 46C-IIa TaxID=1963025 RepID=UPI0009BEF51B|nr:flagellin [Geobacillus sp. 46C-IIa]OQP07649.1 flagellin [Geobacillus sp. 46C-IIa]QNU28191.1 flagellin [Geobacillus sp. 46C-IIa]
MRINHNIAALNTYRQLTIGQGAAAKNMEKLSSGLRINRAGDDAAGLAISEKMRGQIRGLEMSSKNAQDGISLIQTAEGALNETHSILQRMRELAVQAASDTNTATDRAELQKEVDQLSQELSRIGNTTEFNTQKLLNGTFSGTFHIGANENQNLALQISDMRGFALGVADNVTYTDTATLTNTNGIQDIANGTYTVRKNDSTGNYELINSDGLAVATSADGKTYTAVTGDDQYTFNDAVTSGTVTIDYTNSKATGTAAVTNNGLEAGKYTYNSTSGELKNASGQVVATSSDDKTFKDAAGTTLFTLGAALTSDTTFEVKGINISTQEAANKAITTINTAIEKVSAERAKLGAYQNRLEHTINNLGTAAENLTAAESRIRDVDYALAA